jgi:hypothetical protein
MPGSCYLCCCSAEPLAFVLLRLRGIGRRERSICAQCADDLREAPWLFWGMAGVELLAVHS